MNKRSLLAGAWLLSSLLAIPASATPVIAVYGSQPLSTSSGVFFYDASGNLVGTGAGVLFQNSVGAGVGPNATIEDIAFDRNGNLYAIGKPRDENLRTVFRSNAAKTRMEIIHQDVPYGAGVDGSIAVASDGRIAIQGADGVGEGRLFAPGLGSSLGLLYESANGGFGAGPDIEDLAFDAGGTLYALGRPVQGGQRGIFSNARFGDVSIGGNVLLDIVHQDVPYGAGVDGSIAVASDGRIAIQGADGVGEGRLFAPGLGSSLGLLYESANGGFGAGPDIEDLAFDAGGTLYALGRPVQGGQRSIFSNARFGDVSIGGNVLLDILFQDFPYDPNVDGSIALFDVLAEANDPYVFSASNLDVILDSTGSSGSFFEWQVGAFGASGEQVTLNIVDSGLTMTTSAPVGVDLTVGLSGTTVAERDTSQVSYQNAAPTVASAGGTENADFSYTFDILFDDLDLGVNNLIAGFEDLVRYELLFGFDAFLSGSLALDGLDWSETLSRAALDGIFGGSGTFSVDAQVFDKAGGFATRSFDITLSSSSGGTAPEPSSLALVVAGLAALGLGRRRSTWT